MDILVDVGAVRAGEILLLVDLEEVAVDEVRAVLERGGVDLQHQLDLLAQRNVEGVLLDRGLPGYLAQTLLRGELHGRFLELGVRLGDGDRFACRLGDAVRRHVVRGEEAPAAVGDHAHAHAEALGVDDVFHAVLTRDDVLVEIASDPHVRVGRALLGGGVERGVGELLLIGGDGRSRFAEGTDGAAPDG